MDIVDMIFVIFLIVAFPIAIIGFEKSIRKEKKIKTIGTQTKAKLLGYYYENKNIVTDEYNYQGRMVLSFDDEMGVNHIVIERDIHNPGYSRYVTFLKRYKEGEEITILYAKKDEKIFEDKIEDFFYINFQKGHVLHTNKNEEIVLTDSIFDFYILIPDDKKNKLSMFSKILFLEGFIIIIILSIIILILSAM